MCTHCSKCCSLKVELCWFDEVPEYVIEWNGGFPYMKQLNGKCIALVENNCSIYKIRPQECIDFQCYGGE